MTNFSLNDKHFNDLLIKDVEIPYGSFNYPCRLKVNPDAQYLSVQLHGAVPNRREAALPIFSRWNYGKILGAHVLSICDPTIYLSEDLSVGWYLGSREENAIQGIVAIASRCAEILGVGPERVIFSGSSGGGFAALQAAALVDNGKAIAINAQTNLMRYPERFLQSYAELAANYSSIEEARETIGNRWNVIDSLNVSCNSGRNPQIVIVQNRNEWHYSQHYLPFAEAFGLNPQEEQSISGSFMSILYDGSPDHGPEPMEVVKRINNEAVPFLLNLDSASKSRSGCYVNITVKSGQIHAQIEIDGPYQFACYLYKDNVIAKKNFNYSQESKFVFDLIGDGNYRCEGFVKDQSGEIFSAISNMVHVDFDKCES